MKISRLLNLLLAIAVVVLALKVAFTPSPKEKPATACRESSSTEVLENIFTRTSVRDYQDQPVEAEKVEQLLRAAMAAPSAGNKQPWKFVVVQDREMLNTIADNLHTIKMAAKAPLAIVVCGDLTLTFPGDGIDYWIEDTSAATENLLLAAHGLGLGAVWCGIYPLQDRVAFLKELLQLPENIVPLNVVPIGYPAENPTPKDKWKPESVRLNTWAEE